MRVLVVGEGVAGAAVSALLAQRGAVVHVVERQTRAQAAGGYVLGLYPLGDRVLHGLQVFGDLERASQALEAYEVCDLRGRTLKRFDLRTPFESLGVMRGLDRSALIEALRKAPGDLDRRYSTTVTSIAASRREVLVTTSDGDRRTYDLVVGADGIHSQVRTRVRIEADAFDTAWACWTWEARLEDWPAGLVREFWGAARLLGVYPTASGVGAVACAPASEWTTSGEGRAQRIRGLFADLRGPAASVLDHIPDDDASMHLWRLEDRRSREWRADRVVLLGDAACAFLPTAGVGASMALESASVLAEELARASPLHLDAALSFYERRRRPRCEGAQNASRRLSRLMFLRNPFGAALRNRAMTLARAKDLAGDILRLGRQPI